MVVRIEVDTSGLSKMSAWVAGLQGQLPYATSRALNDTARQAAADGALRGSGARIVSVSR